MLHRVKKACAYVADKLHLIELTEEEGKLEKVEGDGNNAGESSAFSSIAASRRPSAIITDPSTMPTMNIPNVRVAKTIWNE